MFAGYAVDNVSGNARGMISNFNPLSPSIKLQFLLLGFRTFLTELVGTSCQNINRI